MTSDELVDAIKRAGGVLELHGGNVKCLLPQAVAHLVSTLRERRAELVTLVRERGGRVAAFPHCPRCAGFVLYREHNIGPYECLTCGQLEIEESMARRLV